MTTSDEPFVRHASVEDAIEAFAAAASEDQQDAVAAARRLIRRAAALIPNASIEFTAGSAAMHPNATIELTAGSAPTRLAGSANLTVTAGVTAAVELADTGSAVDALEVDRQDAEDGVTLDEVYSLLDMLVRIAMDSKRGDSAALATLIAFCTLLVTVLAYVNPR